MNGGEKCPAEAATSFCKKIVGIWKILISLKFSFFSLISVEKQLRFWAKFNVLNLFYLG